MNVLPKKLTAIASALLLGAGMALALVYPFDNYLNTGSTIAWVIGFILMFPLTAMTLLKIDEVAEVTVGNRPIRLLCSRPMAAPLRLTGIGPAPARCCAPIRSPALSAAPRLRAPTSARWCRKTAWKRANCGPDLSLRAAMPAGC